MQSLIPSSHRDQFDYLKLTVTNARRYVTARAIPQRRVCQYDGAHHQVEDVGLHVQDGASAELRSLEWSG